METIDVFLTEESLTKTKSHRFCLWLNFPSLKFTPNDIFRPQLYFQTTADISTHAIFAKTEWECKPTLFRKQTQKDLSWHILSSLYKKMRWISEQEFTHLSFTFSDTNCQKDAKTMKCAWSLSTSKYFLAYVSIMKISLCLTKNSLKIRKKDKKNYR